jgi:hypothetical protein
VCDSVLRCMSAFDWNWRTLGPSFTNPMVWNLQAIRNLVQCLLIQSMYCVYEGLQCREWWIRISPFVFVLNFDLWLLPSGWFLLNPPPPYFNRCVNPLAGKRIATGFVSLSHKNSFNTDFLYVQTKFRSESLKERDHSVDLGLDGKKILECILGK